MLCFYDIVTVLFLWILLGRNNQCCIVDTTNGTVTLCNLEENILLGKTAMETDGEFRGKKVIFALYLRWKL